MVIPSRSWIVSLMPRLMPVWKYQWSINASRDVGATYVVCDVDFILVLPIGVLRF